MTENRERPRVHRREVPRRQPVAAQVYADDHEGVRKLEAALAMLRPLDRQIFLAASIDRLPADKIARRTGLTVALVEISISRSVVTLDRALRRVRAPWWLWRGLRWWRC